MGLIGTLLVFTSNYEQSSYLGYVTLFYTFINLYEVAYYEDESRPLI